MLKRIVFFILAFSFSSFTAGAEDLCEFFMYCPGSRSSRSSSQSLPNSGSAAGLNPSNIAKVKGFGLETIYQPGNSPVFDIVSGNGKVGALISPTQENTFFGNRAVEIDEVYAQRREDKKQFKNKKLSLSVAANLIDKKWMSFDVGVSAKRNPDVKKINPGAGASLRLSIFNFGIYTTKDDVKVDLGSYINPYSQIPYTVLYNAPTYTESYNMLTYAFGVQLDNLALDAGFIKTNYKFYPQETLVQLWSASYTYKKYLFSLAQRKEYSSNAYYDSSTRTLLIQRKKTDYYYGVQYLYNKHVMLGLAYNNFLLKELSASLTLFF